MKMKMVTRFYEAGLAALAKYALAFVFTHAHTHWETMHSASVVG